MMVDAAKSSGSSPYGGHGHNFRVVLDSAPGNDKNTRLMFKNKITKSPFSISPDNVKALVKQARKEFQEISKKSKALSKDVVDKFKENLQHYSKLELGFYAALTVALTVTLKSELCFVLLWLLAIIFCRLLLSHSFISRTSIHNISRCLFQGFIKDIGSEQDWIHFDVHVRYCSLRTRQGT